MWSSSMPVRWLVRRPAFDSRGSVQPLKDWSADTQRGLDRNGDLFGVRVLGVEYLVGRDHW
jgi:hypothetical protein